MEEANGYRQSSTYGHDWAAISVANKMIVRVSFYDLFGMDESLPLLSES